MCIAAIGSGQNQLLASLLSRLTTTSSISADSTSASAGAGSCSTDSTTAASGSGLTGSATAQLSADVLGLLLMMQSDPSSGTANASSSAAASTSTSPLSSLVSAIDTDGDGTISQSELETYIEGQGGTQAQADALYAGLDQNGSGNLTQTQLASDLQNAAPVHHGHHHHHHGAAGASSGQVGSQLVQAMDSNGDGSVDQSEFESFVTALGGTASQADADFSALSGQSGGGITATQFGSAISAFEQSANAGSSIVLNLLDDVAKTVTGTAASGTAAG